MGMLQNPNEVVRRPPRLISICQLLFSNKTDARLVTKYPNKIYVSEEVYEIDQAVHAHDEYT
jgi:hypothetical protein